MTNSSRRRARTRHFGGPGTGDARERGVRVAGGRESAGGGSRPVSVAVAAAVAATAAAVTASRSRDCLLDRLALGVHHVPDLVDALSLQVSGRPVLGVVVQRVP